MRFFRAFEAAITRVTVSRLDMTTSAPRRGRRHE